jgi:uncharacterized protein involved in cysteine biosynthesis
MLPALVALLGMALGALLGWLATPRVEQAVIPQSWPLWFGVPARIAVWIWTPLSGLVLGLALALVLASPLLELLQRRVETLETGSSPEVSRGFFWDLVQSLRGALYFAAAAPLVFVIGLIPFVGPPLAALWAARSLAFQQTDSPLGRRGNDFRQRRRWHAEWRLETLGFGLAGLTTLLVPGVNLIAVPSLAIGAARLVIELESLQQAPGGDEESEDAAETPAREPEPGEGPPGVDSAERSPEG